MAPRKWEAARDRLLRAAERSAPKDVGIYLAWRPDTDAVEPVRTEPAPTAAPEPAAAQPPPSHAFDSVGNFTNAVASLYNTTLVPAVSAALGNTTLGNLSTGFVRAGPLLVSKALSKMAATGQPPLIVAAGATELTAAEAAIPAVPALREFFAPLLTRLAVTSGQELVIYAQIYMLLIFLLLLLLWILCGIARCFGVTSDGHKGRVKKEKWASSDDGDNGSELGDDDTEYGFCARFWHDRCAGNCFGECGSRKRSSITGGESPNLLLMIALALNETGAANATLAGGPRLLRLEAPSRLPQISSPAPRGGALGMRLGSTVGPQLRRRALPTEGGIETWRAPAPPRTDVRH